MYNVSNYSSLLFCLVSAVYKAPELRTMYNETTEVKFAIIKYDKIYSATWNSEMLNQDEFEENDTISFSVERWWYFFPIDQWTRHPVSKFEMFETDFTNGSFKFKQRTNRRRTFTFDVSVVVLIKHTKNLDIWYTSTILSFAPRLFFASTNSLLEYCDLWFKETNELIKVDDLQSCPCTLESVKLDPEFISDPTCQADGSDCHENVGAVRCFLKRIDKM